MSIVTKNPEAALILGVVAVGVLWFMFRGLKGVASDVVTGAADVAAGVVIGVGDATFVPATNMTQCEKDIASTDIMSAFRASVSCPAKRFGEYMLTGK